MVHQQQIAVGEFCGFNVFHILQGKSIALIPKIVLVSLDFQLPSDGFLFVYPSIAARFFADSSNALRSSAKRHARTALSADSSS